MGRVFREVLRESFDAAPMISENAELGDGKRSQGVQILLIDRGILQHPFCLFNDILDLFIFILDETRDVGGDDGIDVGEVLPLRSRGRSQRESVGSRAWKDVRYRLQCRPWCLYADGFRTAV